MGGTLGFYRMRRKKQEVGGGGRIQHRLHLSVEVSLSWPLGFSSVEVSLSWPLEFSSFQYFHALVFLAFTVSDLWVALLFFVSCLSISLPLQSIFLQFLFLFTKISNSFYFPGRTWLYDKTPYKTHLAWSIFWQCAFVSSWFYTFFKSTQICFLGPPNRIL